jgi:hypothetical protein
MFNLRLGFRAFFLPTAFSTLLAVGCAPKDCVTYDNYTKIRATMHTAADVEAILGEPDSKLPDLWIYQRPDAHLTVMIDFDEKGKVSRTQWIDALGETWHDTTDKK